MSYEIITPNGKDLHFRVHLDLDDTLENRKKVHEIKDLVEKLEEKKVPKINLNVQER